MATKFSSNRSLHYCLSLRAYHRFAFAMTKRQQSSLQKIINNLGRLDIIIRMTLTLSLIDAIFALPNNLASRARTQRR